MPHNREAILRLQCLYKGGVSAVWVSLLACFACSTEATPPLAPSPPDPEPTEADWVDARSLSGSVLWARCRPSTNALRVDCEAELSAASSLTWSVDGMAAVVVSEGTEHAVTLYGVGADQVMRWEATAPEGSAAGELRTEALPVGLTLLRTDVQGDTERVPAVLFRYGCADSNGLMVVDGAGEIRWFEPLDTPPTSVSWDYDQGYYSILARGTVLHGRFAGPNVFRTATLDDPLHHDASADDLGQVWALTAHLVEGVVADGLAVWSPAGELLDTWQLADHVPVGEGRSESMYWNTAFPSVPDWSHGNSIVVSEGLGLLSLRWLDAVVALDAEVGSPTFGEVQWVLSGRDDAELGSDLERLDGVGFVGQHHVSFTRDGRLMLFDNRQPPAVSRVLQLGIDLDAGTVWLEEAWNLDQHCEVQGAAYELDDGTVVATCGPASRAQAFERGNPEQVWSLEVSCATLPHRLVPRFIPVEGVFGAP